MSFKTATTCFTLHNPQALYNPNNFAYSHLAEVTQFQRILHISGQGGEDTDGVLSSDFAVQIQQVFSNLQTALAHVDATLFDIAMLRIFVVDHDDQKHCLLIHHMQKQWAEHPFPACTLIPVPCLALSTMLLEIEATAYCQ